MEYYGLKTEKIGNLQVFVKLDNLTTLHLWHVKKHSPDGFQWGYGGSGPADLALSILTDYNERKGLRELMIDEIYQQFKEDFIVTAEEKLSISSKQIEEWLDKIMEENK